MFLMTGDDGGGLLVRFTMGDDGDRPINFPSFESILSDRARAFPLIPSENAPHFQRLLDFRENWNLFRAVDDLFLVRRCQK